MSRMLLVSQHREAKKWMASRYRLTSLAEVPSLTPAMVKAGDVVYVAKTLPWPILAELCGITHRVEFLISNLPRGLRGKELTAKQLKELKAYFAPLHITTHSLPLTPDVVLVTRHPGSQAWLRQRFPTAPLMEHWEEADWARVKPGTTVVGVFPPEMVRELNRRGGQFYALQFSQPVPYGVEVPLATLAEYGPHLQGYAVKTGPTYECTCCGTAFMQPHGWSCVECGGYGDYLSNPHEHLQSALVK